MSLNITRPNATQAVIFSLLLIGLALVPFNQFEQTQIAFTPIQKWLDYIFNVNIWGLYVACFIMLATIVTYIGRIGVRSSTLVYRGYASMIIFVALTLAFIDVTQVPRALLSVLLVMVALNNVMNSRTTDELATGQWVLVGWWIAIATVVSTGAAVMIMVIPLGLLFYRNSNPKEFLASIGGLLLPALIIHCLYVIFAVNGVFSSVGLDSLWIYPSLFDVLGNQSIAIHIYFGYVLLFGIVISLLGLLVKRNSQLAVMRGYLFYFVLAIVIVATMLLVSIFSPTLILLLFLVLSYILAKGFEAKKPNLWLSIIYVIFILGAIICKYHPLFLVYYEKFI